MAFTVSGVMSRSVTADARVTADIAGACSKVDATPTPRFVVTNLPYQDRYLYDRVYCARGDMENRIKDQQLNLFATRTSCMRLAANQLRILLSGLAYTLFEGLRRMALGDTELAKASPDRIRLTLLRIGAVVLRNTRRIRFLLSSTCPHQALFRTVAWRLDSS